MPISLFFIALSGILFFPHIPLLYFAPFLVLSFYRCSRFALLWRALLCGLIIDLLSSSTPFGLTALNYTLVCWVLYGQRLNFFQDKLSTLPLMTLFFSLFSTVLMALLFLFFSQPLTPSFRWFFTDFCCLPLFDAGYALLLAIPFSISRSVRRVVRARRRAQ